LRHAKKGLALNLRLLRLAESRLRKEILNFGMNLLFQERTRKRCTSGTEDHDLAGITR